PRLLRNQRRTLVRRRERQGPVGLCSGGSGAGHGRAENAGGNLRAALARWDPVLRGSPLREDVPGVEDVAGVPRLAVAGSMLRGVGVPATVASGVAAADKIIADLG